MKFRTILCDPPWPERGGGKIKRGADRHYPVMSVKEIMALPVQPLLLPDCHLYLWVTNNYLPDGLRVMAAWGFRYVTMITWAKLGNPGLGQYFRGATEHCLFGVKGRTEYRTQANGKRAQGKTLITTEVEDGWAYGTVIEAERGRHSEKPEKMREMIEVVSHGPYLELFARTVAPGWHVWGNEVEGEVELLTLAQGKMMGGGLDGLG